MLERVAISDPGGVMGRYAHQLSGGMQQRVVIAMALATDPTLLILDEPTTGLDATVEAEVLDLVTRLREEFGTAVLFISHNLAVIGRCASGRRPLRRPARRGGPDAADPPRRAPPVHRRAAALHPAARCPQGPRPARHDPGLPAPDRRGARRLRLHRPLRARPGHLPRAGAAADPARRRPLRRCHFHEEAPEPPPGDAAEPGRRQGAARRAADPPAREPRQDVPSGGHEVQALVDVSAEIWPGETLGLVGESGSGKTTLARTVLGLVSASAGAVRLDGNELAGTLAGRDAKVASALQIVFQNPESALNRRHTVRRLLSRSLCKLAGLKGAAAERRSLDARRAPSGWPTATCRPARAALRRPQAARRDRPRLRRRPAARRLRRADLRARRVRPGGDPQPAGRPAGERADDATSSSRTTSASSATCPTGSPSCTSDG